MLNWIPIVLAAVLTEGSAGLRADPDDLKQRATFEVVDATMHHYFALLSAASEIHILGPVEITVQSPFVSEGNWQSELVSEGTNYFLLTWPAGRQDNPRFKLPIENATSILQRMNGIRFSTDSVSGFWQDGGSGQGIVSGNRIPNPINQINLNTPVIVTKVRP